MERLPPEVQIAILQEAAVVSHTFTPCIALAQTSKDWYNAYHSRSKELLTIQLTSNMTRSGFLLLRTAAALPNIPDNWTSGVTEGVVLAVKEESLNIIGSIYKSGPNIIKRLPVKELQRLYTHLAMARAIATASNRSVLSLPGFPPQAIETMETMFQAALQNDNLDLFANTSTFRPVLRVLVETIFESWIFRGVVDTDPRVQHLLRSGPVEFYVHSQCSFPYNFTSLAKTVLVCADIIALRKRIFQASTARLSDYEKGIWNREMSWNWISEVVLQWSSLEQLFEIVCGEPGDLKAGKCSRAVSMSMRCCR